MTAILNRHMMQYITNSASVPQRQLWVQREKVKEAKKQKSRSQMLIFSWLVWAQRTRADELSTEFLTQWCQTRDCDVQLAQVNSGAPAGNTQTQTQTDCYQVWVVISVFGSAANHNDSFALHCFIKEAFGDMAYGTYWKCWSHLEMAVLLSIRFKMITIIISKLLSLSEFCFFTPSLIKHLADGLFCVFSATLGPALGWTMILFIFVFNLSLNCVRKQARSFKPCLIISFALINWTWYSRTWSKLSPNAVSLQWIFPLFQLSVLVLFPAAPFIASCHRSN